MIKRVFESSLPLLFDNGKGFFLSLSSGDSSVSLEPSDGAFDNVSFSIGATVLMEGSFVALRLNHGCRF